MIVYRRITGADIASKHRPTNLLYCGRGTGSRGMGSVVPGIDGWLGNPYRVGDFTLAEAIRKFGVSFRGMLKTDIAFLTEMNRWKAMHQNGIIVIGCWCASIDVCHTQHIKEWLNEG